MSITKRKNGKFTAQIKDPDTKLKVSLGTFKRYTDAQAAITAAEDAKAHGEPIKNFTKGGIPFNKFVDEVFLKSPRLRVSDKTKKHYETNARRLTEYFGDEPLNSITQQKCLDFNEAFRHKIDKKTGEEVPRSDNYRRKTAQMLRQVFNIAVEEGYIPANAHPYKPDIKANQLPPRPREAVRVVLSHEAALQILTVLQVLSVDPTADEASLIEADYWYHFLGTALHTGMRMSELVGLRIDNLDWQSTPPCVRVKRQWGWDINTQSEEKRFPQLKSRYADRAIPMLDNKFQELSDWAAEMRQQQTDSEYPFYDLVFPRPNPQRRSATNGWGLWGSASDFSKRYKKMLGRVWVYYQNNIASKPHVKMPFTEENIVVPIHSWRHAYCVGMLTAGVDAMTVAKWMGHHGNGSFTYEVYSRYVPTMLTRNMDKVAAIYDKQKQTNIGI